MRGGDKAVIIPHRHEGVFIAKSKGDALVTKSMVPGDSVYNEKRISVQVIFYCFFFYSQSPFHLIETDFFTILQYLCALEWPSYLCIFSWASFRMKMGPK